MIAFRLEDFNEIPLREAAVQLGIVNAANMKKDDLIKEIKNKISPNTAIIFTPMNTSVADPKPPDRVSRVISVLALVVSMASAGASYWGVITTLNKIHTDSELKDKESWQAVTVYDIIEHGTAADKSKWNGLTFDEIKSKYREEVTSAKNPKLGNTDLQPEALQKILVGMIETGLVHRTIDDRFVVQRATVASRDSLLQSTTSLNCARIILKLLAIDATKYTVDKLAAKLNADYKIDAEEYWATINAMKAQGLISIDIEEHVYSAVNPPKKK